VAIPDKRMTVGSGKRNLAMPRTAVGDLRRSRMNETNSRIEEDREKTNYF
jgi:hypothetical protein